MKINIERLGFICDDAAEYYNSFCSELEAWEKCERADWMLYVAALLNVNTRKLVLAKARCAETVKHLMVDERSIVAIEKAIQFGLGEIDIKELDEAAYAATSAAEAAYASTSAAEAAYAAKCASKAAATYAYAAADTATYSAKAAATYAAAYASKATVIKNQQIFMSNICREILTEEIIKVIKILKHEK